MNGEELKHLHDDIKELTIANKDLVADVRVLTTKVDIYLDDVEDHEDRIRGLEKSEKYIKIVVAAIAAIATFGDELWALLQKLIKGV